MTDDFEFPRRVGGELTLPGGEVVWVQTLNTLQRAEADKRARRAAMMEARRLLPGGEDEAALRAEVGSLSVEEQVTFVASASRWRIREEALRLFPDPGEPAQGEGGLEALAAAQAEWEARCVGAAERRREYEEARLGEERERAAARGDAERAEECCRAAFQQEFAAVYDVRMKLETLCRAVRTAGDHSIRVFGAIGEVADLEDAALAALWGFYADLEGPVTTAVPTLPARC